MHSPGFLTSFEAISFYHCERKSLQLAAIGGNNRDSIERSKELRSDLRAQFRLETLSLKRLRAIHRLISTDPQIQELIANFNPNHLLKIGSRLLPLIDDKYGLKTHNLPMIATEVLLNLPLLSPLSDEIREIFSSSKFSQADFAYRTLDGVTGPIIFGENSTRMISLIGIAHELGHCLIERRFGSENFYKKVLSETFAQIFEFETVHEYLLKHQPNLCVAWRTYQSDVDAINFILCLQESNHLLHSNNQSDFFDDDACALRESYFTAPGYQSVYALASMCRARLTKRAPHFK